MIFCSCDKEKTAEMTEERGGVKAELQKFVTLLWLGHVCNFIQCLFHFLVYFFQWNMFNQFVKILFLQSH